MFSRNLSDEYSVSARSIALRHVLAAALIVAAPVARASWAGDSDGYVTDREGQPVTDSFGDCVHTGYWQPGMRFAHCEPQPIKPVAAALEPPKAPNAVAPARKAQEPARPAPRPAPFRLSADALFDFDSARLRPEGRAALDVVEQRIAGAVYRSVQITGHADRIGSPGYNLHLSERRALAVRAYLAERGLDAGKISAKGVGSAESLTASGQCDGLHDALLIQCLQPDRYAEVTVVADARAASAR